MAKEPDEIEITPEMVEAGIWALRGLCPFDVAFPFGGEEAAVAAVLRAAFRERSRAALIVEEAA